jgi:uncharacterized protein (UPF0276 family)
LGPLQDHDLSTVNFMEVAPENWMGIGGRLRRALRRYTEQFPFVCHGLSLSLGGPAPLDETFIRRMRRFFDQYDIRSYTEHLSYCTDDGHLYDLMPIPFTEEAVHYVAGRIRRTQDLLERRIGIENVSYYAAPGARLSELPGERIVYGHIAGHFNEAEDLIVDTHGADVIPSVWTLLDKAYQTFGVFPTLLERDFNFPPVPELLAEVDHIHRIQQRWKDDEQETENRRSA